MPGRHRSPGSGTVRRSSRHMSRFSHPPRASTGSGSTRPTFGTSLTCWLNSGRPLPTRRTCCMAGAADRRAPLDTGHGRGAIYTQRTYVRNTNILRRRTARRPTCPPPPLADRIEMIGEPVHEASDVFSARNAFLSGDERPSAVRPEIFASWRRSALLGAQPDIPALPFHAEIDNKDALHVAAR